MSRKPCDADLTEIAEYLHDLHPDSAVYPAAKRVAYWLADRTGGDRAMARKLGVTVSYYRRYLVGPAGDAQ